MWGDTEPSETLRAVGPQATALARTDLELAEHLAALEPDTLRHLAQWVARTSWERAGAGNLDWGAALGALERGQALPAPFDDHRTAWSTLYPSSGMAVTMTPHGGTPPREQLSGHPRPRYSRPPTTARPSQRSARSTKPSLP
jgi:hypothetical protein